MPRLSAETTAKARAAARASGTRAPAPRPKSPGPAPPKAQRLVSESSVGPSATTMPVGRNDWSPEHLYLHLTGKIEDLKAHVGDLRTSDHIALNAALAAQEKAVAAALAAVKDANEKYEREVERWRHGNNNWREAMDRRELNFVQVTTFDARLSGMWETQQELRKIVDDGFKELREFRDRETGRRTAQTAFMGIAFAALTVALRFI